MIESLSSDQNAVGGPLDDLGNGRFPGFPVPGCHGNDKAFEVFGEGAGVALEVRAPFPIGEASRFPAGEWSVGCWSVSLVLSGEFVVEGITDEAADPGTDVDIAFIAEA